MQATSRPVALVRWGLIVALAVLVVSGVLLSLRSGSTAVSESGPELGVPSLVPVSPEQTKSTPTPASSASTQASVPPTPSVVSGTPKQITIPSIGVKAPTDAVGTEDDGSQEVPKSFYRTGWFELGAKPGASGNAVIVGHTWSKGDGVFDKLPNLSKGAIIQLATSGGTLAYRVTSVGSVTPTQFAKIAPDVYRTSGPSGLVLMTCGDFQPQTGVYQKTTIVYAQLATN